MATLETSPGDEMTFPGSQFDDESSDATGPHPLPMIEQKFIIPSW